MFHIPWRIACSNYGNLGLKKERYRLLPFMHRGWVTETWMEADEAVEVGVIGVEMTGFVHVMVIFYKCADLHGIGYPVFNYGTERIQWCAFGKRKLVLPVGHTFGANEVQRKLDAMEKVR